MMQESIISYRNFSVIWTMLHIFILSSFLFESRYSVKKTGILCSLFLVPLAIINFILYSLIGPVYYTRVAMIFCTLPSLIFFYFLSKYRDGRFFFAFFFTNVTGYMLVIITSLLSIYLGKDLYIVVFVIRLIAFPLLEILVWKRLRQLYLKLQDLTRGWASFAILSACYYVLLITMFSYPTLIVDRLNDLPSMLLVLIMMPIVTVIIFADLIKQKKY